MTNDLADHTGIELTESRPPLCLVHYFAERGAYPPERNPKPPGRRSVGRVAERDGNLIILEFVPAPHEPPERWRGGRRGKSLGMRVCDALMLLLFLASMLACLAAFRY